MEKLPKTIHVPPSVSQHSVFNIQLVEVGKPAWHLLLYRMGVALKQKVILVESGD